ncbi:MAG TPA: hypothetical protein PKY77_05735 [Phycisphaerae bacterium]|nr:hypothetical protein [Phycisphaerae bacterium]HRY69055.1 hypothetical protein [Phycisphaerae bacterium]HSA25970.1 hypothetical protein [Phycisphaerae bacterium]
MSFAQLLKCKTVWVGIAMFFTGLGTIFADGQTAEGIRMALEGLGFITLRSGLLKLGNLGVIGQVLESFAKSAELDAANAAKASVTGNAASGA